ncbi:MAG: glycosyltransferase family 2 protein [Acidobacteria bacterium]|nr:glycosyltransferase family 2 protein [Acidobacteriota bacterium]
MAVVRYKWPLVMSELMGEVPETGRGAGLVFDRSHSPVHCRRTVNQSRQLEAPMITCDRKETPVVSDPSVSVVMPVWNGARYLDVSIRSILQQTFRRFELVIADDGSTDGTWEILSRWAARDARIRLLRSPQRLGPVGSSNLVARAARAPLVARMDADDWSHPDRLARQIDVLRRYPDAVLVGTLFHGMDSRGTITRPLDRWRLKRPGASPPFAHGSTMYRRKAFEIVGGYREACVYWEDLDLYRRLRPLGRLLVIPEGLYVLRYHSGSARAVDPSADVIRALSLMARCSEAYRATGDYEALLSASSTPDASPHLPTGKSALPSLLWGGQPLDMRPRSALSQIARFPESALIMAVDLLERVHGGTAPFLARSFVATRDWLAGWSIDGSPVEWQTTAPASGR